MKVNISSEHRIANSMALKATKNVFLKQLRKVLKLKTFKLFFSNLKLVFFLVKDVKCLNVFNFGNHCNEFKISYLHTLQLTARLGILHRGNCLPSVLGGWELCCLFYASIHQLIHFFYIRLKTYQLESQCILFIIIWTF